MGTLRYIIFMKRNTNMTTLTTAETKCLKALLTLAAGHFSNHGCNDFLLDKEAKLSPEEIVEINTLMNVWLEKDDPLFEPVSLTQRCTFDWLLMQVLADKL